MSLRELSGGRVDPVIHRHDDGLTTIEWPEGTTEADWVKVSVPLLREMNDELNRLRIDARLLHVPSERRLTAPPDQENPA